jgi:type VI secretion system secreted protein VgrG
MEGIPMPRHSNLRFTFRPEAGPVAFDVIDFTLIEGLSQPFRLRLNLSSHDPDIDFTELLDNAALFTLWHGDTAVRHVHGLISRFSIGQSGFRRTHYQAVVEPQLARLALSANWRIFQHLSVPQIIDKVLGEQHLFNREQIITAAHQPREYCVQAGETDLHFLARLAAEEGLLYTFEHSDSGHRLIHTDRVMRLGQIGPEEARTVLYQGTPGGDPAQPAITGFHYTEQVRTASQVQRDYTFTHPRYPQQHEAYARDLHHQSDAYERFDYPGRYKRDAVGKPFTETRLLALRNDARIAEAVGDDPRIKPGQEFQLIEHPREAFNTFWRTVSVVHEGQQSTSQEEDVGDTGTTYRQTARLIDGRADWKADLLPKPRIDGPQTATVTGPPGEAIYCDEWGRIKISFPWDRESQQDDKSSCWVRVSQGWAGTTWGAMAIPRVGQEVIVGYHDGDPDQPIVLGRTYRAANLPPYELPRHKTRMTIKSQSHKGEGFNELRFEDELGREELFIHAERDQNTVVKNHQALDVGVDRAKRIGQDERTTVGRHRDESVGTDEKVAIGQDRHHGIGRDDTLLIARSQTIVTGQDRIEHVGNQRHDKTGANHQVEIGGHLTQNVAGRAELDAGQAISRRTQVYELQAADSLTIKAAGGMLRIDAAGITLEGLTLRIKAPIEHSGNGKGQSFSFSGTPEAGEPVCEQCLLDALAQKRNLTTMQEAKS